MSAEDVCLDGQNYLSLKPPVGGLVFPWDPN